MNIRRKQVTIAAVLAVFTTLSVVAAPPGSGWSKNNNYSDNFNYWGNPNSGKWKEFNSEDWSKNGVKSWYHPDNVSCNGNALVIESKWNGNTVPSGYQYSGGRIDSKTKMLYGWYECRSRLDWMDKHFWCTYWLWEWRADKSATEFDVMEFQHWHNTPSQSHHYRYKTGRTTAGAAPANVQSWNQWGLLWYNNHVSLWIGNNKQFDSNNGSNAAGDQLPMIFTSSPNRDFNPARSGNYPRFFVDWVEVWKGGTVGGGGGGTSAPTGKTIALKSQGSGKYVKANGSGTGWTLQAINNTATGSWEKFAVVDAGGGYIGLKSLGSNKYVKANGAGTNWKLQAINNNIGGSWEKFQWMPQSDGTIGLKSQGSGKYVKANGPGSNWTLHAINNNVGGSWEKFSWEVK